MSPSTYLPLTLSLLTVSALADGAFYGDPPDATHPWAIHDMNRPQPARVEPGSFSSNTQPGKPPSDAIILFGGSPEDIKNWRADKPTPEPTKWIVQDGVLQCVPGSGYIRTEQEFSDCQLHVEWSEPVDIQGKSQGRGNSGVFLMGKVEVQVLDIYNNPSYPDGMAAAIYGINPPMINAVRPPGEWQTYDIVFRRPLFAGDQEIDSGYITVFVNGVLTQDHTPLEGPGGHKSRSKPIPFPETGPIKLQDHGNPVRYRNIWIRPLPKRANEGGDASHMSEAGTKAKRAEIAKTVREDAAKREGSERMLRLFESLTYEENAEARNAASAQAVSFADALKALPADQAASKKGEVLQVANALRYLAKFKLLADDFAPKTDLEKIISSNGWEKKK